MVIEDVKKTNLLFCNNDNDAMLLVKMSEEKPKNTKKAWV